MDTKERSTFYRRCINPAIKKRLTLALLSRAMFCHVVDEDDNMSNGAQPPGHNSAPDHSAPPAIQQQIISSSALTSLPRSSQATNSVSRTNLQSAEQLKTNLEKKRKRDEDTKGRRTLVRIVTQQGKIASFPRVTPIIPSITPRPIPTASSFSQPNQERVVIPSPSPVRSILELTSSSAPPRSRGPKPLVQSAPELYVSAYSALQANFERKRNRGD
jgi:hypothetical protein